ncbi:MAG: hypothetical protein F4X09_02980 [Gammaproteobacteria bacterium]|nr:hypothetical protein [Gammaproteobacteria bacterium]MYC59144.1 hypothetical protein [Gammaproteobacteria bacterium]MYH46182.1 hypothetical protein [Gammaproteobacteria bacterium]MYH84900.1 hypothetical protein [Gammaproteobacteria bacterium]MYK03743.1 hypothetical protein [Gammaproteobacteria bacterium]
MGRIVDFAMALLGGGTMEIILLIVLIVVALLLLLLAVWLAWKLLGLLGKGLLWSFRRGGEAAQARSVARREAELSNPPPVAAGWDSSGRLNLRKALRQAARNASPDALRLVVVAGDGFADLCRSLGLTPPGAGRIGIAAGNDAILIDASRASGGELNRLGQKLPWRRPLDGIAILVGAEGLPPDGIARASGLARAAGVKAALHLVLPSANAIAAWRAIDSASTSGEAVCSQLAADSVRIWLVGGDRQGFDELALAQSRELPAAIDRAIAIAPSGRLDVASLSFSGTGLRAAAAQAIGRTRPTTAPGIAAAAAYGAMAVGISLAVLAAFQVVDRTNGLRTTLSAAAREAAVPWTAEGVNAVPNGARVQRLANIGARLAGYSDFPPLTPLAPLVPDWSSPSRLGGALLTSYVIGPLGVTLERRGQDMLEPRADADAWLADARVVGEWTNAWEGLADDPRDVDIPLLLSTAFGGAPDTWPDNIDLALLAVDFSLLSPEEGGLDVAGLGELSRANFILTMQAWATEQYANGPVADAARRASAGGLAWRGQYEALAELRDALQDPSQQWLTAAEDRSDHAVELRLLGRALALRLIGELATIEAKAEVASIRIEAREAAANFVVPGIGPLLERSGTSSGPSLRMTAAASAWLAFLDRVANADFIVDQTLREPLLAGLVTVDRAAVAAARERLRVFDRFAANLSPDIPAAPARSLVNELGAELVVGIAVEVERALRRESDIGLAMARAERRAEATLTFQELAEIEIWLRDRQAHSEADRVRSVRARVADGILTAAANVLDEEDPLAVTVDPAADSDALVRRFERGIQHVRRVHDQFVGPFLDTVSDDIGGWAALHWRDIASDLEGHSRGDPDSTLTTLEGSVRAFADNAEEICEAPRSLPGRGRGDYLVQASNEFRSQLDDHCQRVVNERAVARFREVEEYFNDYVREFWPYAGNGAPEIGIPILGEFVRRLHDNLDAVTQVEDPLTALFIDSANFWSREQDGAAIRFELEWRAHVNEENLAENVAEASLDGVEVDENGIHTWHYGAPFGFRLRIADNSPYRFLQPDGRQTDTWTLAPQGRGGLLRALEQISGGHLLLTADVVRQDDTGQAGSLIVEQLRFSVRMSYEDGRGISMPSFGFRG